MKKTGFVLLIIAVIIGFTSCINSDPTYWGDWDIVDGYMLKESEDSETRHFVEYNTSITDKSHQATRYTHQYSKTPDAVLTIQEWNESKIEYETKTTNRFRISNIPTDKNGFLFYKDGDTLYVINTLFNYEEKNRHLKIHEDRYTKAKYRFIIEVNGIFADIEILMDDKSDWD